MSDPNNMMRCELEDEIIRQQAVIAELLAAVINLRNVAGRYHTEQAFKALMEVVAKHEVKPTQSSGKEE